MNLFSIILPAKNPPITSDVTYDSSVKKKTSSINFAKKIKKITNSVFFCIKKGAYFPQETYISRPRSSSVSKCVFREVPEKLEPYCNDGKIELDNHFFLKESIAYVSSVDCSMIGTQLPENNDGSLVLIEEGEGRKTYTTRQWDMAPNNAWG
ncbi:hypothetical protein LOZ86_00230 [Pectobacterium parvum]|uniref:hypothetical protein n=1 Tax=Pectobacterium parvum TaxID=2778550 RepID=UPI001E32FC40|nr:hypothetical protein [Pectobacterium parvum]UFK39388.1 hypothetical protein LOZ86_00230 [Pectobacterium parvum]